MKTINKIKVALAIIFIVFIIALRFSGINQYINFATIKKYEEYIRAFIAVHYLFSRAVFFLLYVFVVTCMLPFSILLTIVGGYFFGTISSFLLSIAGATCGSICSFFIFRFLLRNALEVQYGNLLGPFNKNFKRYGVYYLLFLQLLPITPFALITILSAISRISWWTYIWTLALGIMPGTIVYAYAGNQFQTITTISDIFSPGIIIVFVALALCSLIPLVIQKFISHEVE